VNHCSLLVRLCPPSSAIAGHRPGPPSTIVAVSSGDHQIRVASSSDVQPRRDQSQIRLHAPSRMSVLRATVERVSPMFFMSWPYDSPEQAESIYSLGSWFRSHLVGVLSFSSFLKPYDFLFIAFLQYIFFSARNTLLPPV